LSGASNPFDMPLINASAETGRPGESISIEGAGWTPNTTIWMGARDTTSNKPVKFCTLVADAGGNIASTTCTIPSTLNTSDTYQLKAYQTTNNHISWLDSNQFTISSAPLNQ
jgi:hypothetical protein